MVQQSGRSEIKKQPWNWHQKTQRSWHVGSGGNSFESSRKRGWRKGITDKNTYSQDKTEHTWITDHLQKSSEYRVARKSEEESVDWQIQLKHGVLWTLRYSSLNDMNHRKGEKGYIQEQRRRPLTWSLAASAGEKAPFVVDCYLTARRDVSITKAQANWSRR
jgi:hypothetical protein